MDHYHQAGQPCSSTKVERKVVEKNRRNKMKILFSHLNSLCPNYNSKEALPLPDQVDHAINYIKSLETNLKLAKEKKERLMRNKRSRSGCLNSSGGNGSIKSPKIEIHENGSSLQVIVTCGADEQFIFCEIMRILHEDYVEVISANSTLVGDSVIHVVHAENPQSLFQFGATKVSERLKRFVNGSMGEAQLIVPQLWDFEIGNGTWDLNSVVNKCLPNSI
ncbi:transcription factor bHLH162-like [Vicia villosa]|uniref:transcription factor bHLH162-like n=1 Tax=Vicia villosa TaxID=3911 RepID=UPI00273CB31C|nr:transcription factor bHLH162-like [Vicia villosa]